ncbi:hypothetical protein NC796_06730 [Aliifodinibius sp. S!AR15-10]|uniref:hypothetical protein n=1 Tax=Aliifodinibius sp. S!AR15-10 TaxID=2950437 RepID=UPI00285978EF|nr:hypothetical protein [Aliifodinibius sp. S!AR15-10]MDR8390823.1 hypothetical protein [Aliifodinibius sp. S!AR15-10]
MRNFWVQVQEDTLSGVGKVDTLTQTYSQKWQAASGMEDASPLIQAAASYDLIFIVLGVSLIIWFILLFFIIRVDKKVSKLEDQVTQQNTK